MRDRPMSVAIFEILTLIAIAAPVAIAMVGGAVGAIDMISAAVMVVLLLAFTRFRLAFIRYVWTALLIFSSAVAAMGWGYLRTAEPALTWLEMAAVIIALTMSIGQFVALWHRDTTEWITSNGSKPSSLDL